MRFIAAMIELERVHPSGPDPTITPEDTLRAGISDWRQAQYQRRMSSLLAGRASGSDDPPRPPVTSKPCPVCAYPIRKDEFDEITECSRCRTDYHTPCFWRELPVAEWVAYWTWLNETGESNYERYICAACRQLEGLEGPR